jgi:putative CRISPR-associated protein (TIGR02620 family)
MKDVIIVTRHAGLVIVLAEDYGIAGPVLAHVTAADVRGKAVVGVLPLHLAAEAKSVTEVTLNLPPELRGQELTIEQVRQHMKGLRTYVVRSLEAFNLNNEEEWRSGYGGSMGWGSIPDPIGRKSK